MLVAPHAGAWIETVLLVEMLTKAKSRLMQARGLKHLSCINAKCFGESRLMQARGLKHFAPPFLASRKASRLMQARGLKPETEFVVVLNPGRASCRRVD